MAARWPQPYAVHIEDGHHQSTREASSHRGKRSRSWPRTRRHAGDRECLCGRSVRHADSRSGQDSNLDLRIVKEGSHDGIAFGQADTWQGDHQMQKSLRCRRQGDVVYTGDCGTLDMGDRQFKNNKSVMHQRIYSRGIPIPPARNLEHSPAEYVPRGMTKVEFSENQ